MSTSPFFEPTRLGALDLKNRIVLAPLTRSRADEHGVPSELAATYYAQRAQAGLVISEATQISLEASGYLRTPGIYTEAQKEAWRRIVGAVHAAGSKMVLQLWHVGRIANLLNRVGVADVVAPSAIQAPGEMYTDAKGMQPHDVPRALTKDDIGRIADEYAAAAKAALEIGFDGVEFHAANGYLMHQFLSSNVNQRDDEYGGSIANRLRAPLQALDAILAVVPSDRVGLRVSPGHAFNDIVEDDTEALYTAYYAELAARNLAYLHAVRPFFAGGTGSDPVAFARKHYNGAIIACGGYDRETGGALLADNAADAVAFGRLFIPNPDLPLRFALNAPLAEPDTSSFYTPGAKGYTDYAIWNGVAT